MRGAILTSMLKRADVATYTIAMEVAYGVPKDGNNVFGLDRDGVGYATSGGFVDPIKAQLDAFAARDRLGRRSSSPGRPDRRPRGRAATPGLGESQLRGRQNSAVVVVAMSSTNPAGGSDTRSDAQAFGDRCSRRYGRLSARWLARVPKRSPLRRSKPRSE